MNDKILVVAAHPDDEVLGCGGTLARLIKEKYDAYTLILGEGLTSRDEERNLQKRKKELQELKQEVIKANNILGVKNVFFHNFPDNRFDTVAFLDIVKVIENIKEKVNPKIIFTHYEKDLNIDHQITFKAVVTAVRPLQEKQVQEVYSFEVLSSTEWNYPYLFSPDVFIDISCSLEDKIKAISAYKSELRKFPHPRSTEGIKILAKMRGMQGGLIAAEAFKCIRIIK